MRENDKKCGALRKSRASIKQAGIIYDKSFPDCFFNDQVFFLIALRLFQFAMKKENVISKPPKP
ncbi:MAG TPA: hypothetical protein VIP53_05355 [Nitrososphaera sp.]